MKKTIPAISVIVCCWNVEETIRRAIDSILQQTFSDFELLLVDDGSPDSCAAIIDEYAQQDLRVVALHKKNGGLSDARNYGLEHATGIYTIFVDPDDWVEATMLENLYTKAIEKNADMVICDYYHNDQYRQTYASQKPTSEYYMDVLKDLVEDKIFGYTWNKLIRLECYKKYNLKYPVGIYGCEDQYLMCALCKNPIKIVYLNGAYYHYVYHQLSLSRRYSFDTYKMDLKIRDMFVNLLSEVGLGQLAFCEMTGAAMYRGFLYGKDVFTSRLYKKLFLQYRTIIVQMKLSSFYKLLLFLSVSGGYKIMYTIWNFGFILKQISKKIFFRKNENIYC